MVLRRGDVEVGTVREATVVDDLTRTQIVMYAGASGDYNPLHTDEVFATQVAGFPGVFAHGMLTMGMTGRALTDWVGEGRLLSFGVQFRGQVWPGDTLVTTMTVTAVHADSVDLDIVTANQDGRDVVVGTATAALEA
ncbi:MaoC/PaaZ C-terminal domain-containing protein [Trujillonella endophytica]|uniref:Acyl dehydratase n=1 Tax=Trujillonella endophytica TaxID=673521 RepID=A0A1H8WM74_9ACTN|nr:MaoC/PaaZ C-terminal domain-containing protein [Trujillella endophytica]SEP28726.1 Acyl dehydratase [Trujillella endophytica]